MRFFAVVAALVSVVSAENFTVMVGQGGNLTYTPSTVTAQNGDVIAFQFVAKNHTVTQSTFAEPCNFMSGGIDSGFFNIAPGATSFPQWSFTITNASTPLWFYCRQTGHCSKGMVFAVNPTQNKTFDAFKAAAEATAANGTTATTGATGATAATTPPSPSASGKPNSASIMSGNTVGFLIGVAAVAGLLL
jgi:plastocyanin